MTSGRKTLALVWAKLRPRPAPRLALAVILPLVLGLTFPWAPRLVLADLLPCVVAASGVAGGLRPQFAAQPALGCPSLALEWPLAFDPASDLDASAATDADDLVVFVADIFEFAEHEQALLVDTLTDVAVVGAATLAGATSLGLSVRALKR